MATGGNAQHQYLVRMNMGELKALMPPEARKFIDENPYTTQHASRLSCVAMDGEYNPTDDACVISPCQAGEDYTSCFKMSEIPSIKTSSDGGATFNVPNDNVGFCLPPTAANDEFQKSQLDGVAKRIEAELKRQQESRKENEKTIKRLEEELARTKRVETKIANNKNRDDGNWCVLM